MKPTFKTKELLKKSKYVSQKEEKRIAR